MYIMVREYKCLRCEYSTPLLGDMKRHLQRKLPCPPVYSDEDTSVILESILAAAVSRPGDDGRVKCPYCEKTFKSAQSKCNHVQRLHNTQQSREAATTVHRVRINRVVNNTINNNNSNNVNIVINAYGQESTDHITNAFLDQCVRRTNKGLVELIEKIHFDQRENRNLRCMSVKVPLIKYHDGTTWKYGRKDKILDELVDKGHGMLQEHFDDNEDNIKDSLSESMFSHISEWMDKMQEKDKKTWEDVLMDMYILILNASVERDLPVEIIGE